VNSSRPAKGPLPRALHALVEFFRLEAAGGITLIAAAALALIAANSPAQDAYEAFRDFTLQAGIGDFSIAKPLLLWINDGLMAIFFLLVALEIKRETLSGQLAGPRMPDPADWSARSPVWRCRRCCSSRSTTAMPRLCAAGQCRRRRISPSPWACSRCWGRACRWA
jgi:hypothetical protein